MGDVRVVAATGTANDWAISNIILAVGQLAWETDTGILRIGDGQSFEPSLPVVAQINSQDITIDDSDADVSGSVVWSALKAQAQDTLTLTAANAYTDAAIQGIQNGSTPRFDVAFQNADGTWGNRPSAYCVFAFTTGGSTVAPNWLVTGIDTLFYRN